MRLTHSVRISRVRPLVAYGFGAFHFARRLRNSAAVRFDLQRSFHRIDRDAVAVPKQTDGSAERRFRRDMSNHEAMTPAGKSSVGDQRDLVAETAPHDGAGRD